jgi:hypothetical protein
MMEFLQPHEVRALFSKLEVRFHAHLSRHNEIEWSVVAEKLHHQPAKIYSLFQMEETGGEPDVVCFESDIISFVDCAKESPKGRRSVCYDQASLDSRKEFKPKNSAVAMAEEMGITMLSEGQYFLLQSIIEVDTKTSSWLLTEPEFRKKGGAIFGDCRYGRTFIYHNGAESYYGSRGFRGILMI